MTNTETLNREVSLGPCPHCSRPLTADAIYVIGAVQADPLPPEVKAPPVPVGAVANITLAGISVTHACGKAEKPSTVMRGGVIGTISAAAGGNTGATRARVHDPRCRLPEDHSATEPCSW